MFIDRPEFRTLVRKWFQIFDHLSIGAFIAADKQIADLNHSAGLIMGVDKRSISDKTCQKLCCSIPCHGRCPFQGTQSYGEECPNVEIIDRHGSKHMVTRFVVPLYTPEKKVKGCFTVLQDHSALTELIQRVEHQERTLKIIFDSIETGIFTVNRGGHFTFLTVPQKKLPVIIADRFSVKTVLRFLPEMIRSAGPWSAKPSTRGRP